MRLFHAEPRRTQRKEKREARDLQGIQIYKKLAWLNELPVDEAEYVFRDCCGSGEWVRLMAASRPFAMLDNLFNRADEIWSGLSTADHLEAFAAHPKIGSAKPAPVQQFRAASWSAGEQAGMDDAEAVVRERLAEANSLYEAKFGFIFIVCATGRSAAEMLAICQSRLGNTLDTELKIAAEEQRKITEIRLGKLLER